MIPSIVWILAANGLVSASAITVPLQPGQGRIVHEFAAPKCLNFIHNPRCGGTSIDSINLNKPKDQRLFHSLMEGPIDGAAGGPSFPHETPGHLFDTAHGSELTNESSETAAEHYGPYIPKLNFRFVTWDFEGKFNQTCQDLHTPPQYDEKIREFFTQPGCESFCTVRDPMDRLISGYKFRNFGECNTESFEKWILETFPLREPISFCHVYPQFEYVYSSNKAEQKQWCQHIIRFENFEKDFNKIMAEFGRDAKMTKHLNPSGNSCINITKLSKEAKDRVYDYYRRDYDTFGYPRP